MLTLEFLSGEFIQQLKTMTMLLPLLFIGGIFNRIADWFDQAWDDVTDWVKTNVVPIINFIEKSERYIDSGAVDVLKKIIPGQIDNGIIMVLREAIDIVTPGKFDTSKNWKTVLNEFFDYINSGFSKSERDALLEELASVILSLKARQDGEEMSFEDAKQAVNLAKVNRAKGRA